MEVVLWGRGMTHGSTCGLERAGDKGLYRCFPNEMFASEGTLTATHVMRGPKGGEYMQKCTVTTLGPVVELDYRPFPENDKDFYRGEMRLVFPSPSRSGVPATIEWKGATSDPFEQLVATASREARPIAGIPVYGDDGKPIQSHFSIDGDGDRVLITLESRGGTIGSKNERNRGYSAGLKLVLERLGSTGCRLEEASLAAKSSSLAGLERDVEPQGFTLPVTLSPFIDEAELATALQRALGNVGSKRKLGSGNTTRRLQLVVTTPTPITMTALITTLAGGPAHGVILDEDIQAASTTLDFDPANEADARKRILTAIARRQGQGKFRNSLKVAYDSACAVTNCTVLQVLEAAHIKPFKGEHTNHVQNGLLLRADIHTLFDMGLVGIDPGTWTVVVHHSIRSGSYSEWHGTSVRLPKEPAHRPNHTALRQHLHQHGLAA